MIVVISQRGSDKTDSGAQKAITKDTIAYKYSLRLCIIHCVMYNKPFIGYYSPTPDGHTPIKPMKYGIQRMPDK